MKPKITFIPRFAILTVATTFALSSAFAQEDVSGHPTVDSPYLRAKAKPSATAGQTSQTSLSQNDQKFLSQVAASGAYEVADGRVAESQGNAETKKIASRIVADRSSSNKELMDLAKKKGVGLNTEKIKARNMGKSDFDRQYIHTITRDYQEDIALFQKQAQSGNDKDVKAWAAKTLPTLKSHLSMLKQAKGPESKEGKPAKEGAEGQ